MRERRSPLTGRKRTATERGPTAYVTACLTLNEARAVGTVLVSIDHARKLIEETGRYGPEENPLVFDNAQANALGRARTKILDGIDRALKREAS